jgi:hypothetical protein
VPRAIKPSISHLKNDLGIGRNFRRGVNGDTIHLLLAPP